MSYTDKNQNNNNSIDLEIIEESNYYPFGLKHKGYNNVVSSNGNSVAQRWKFGGKEYNEELGLDWYDVSARNYDPALGRWMNLDPLAEQMRRHSPYNYAFDNPIVFLDPDGMKPYTDIYNLNGKKIGTDGVNNGKKKIAINSKTAKKIKKQTEAEIKSKLESGAYGTDGSVPSTEIGEDGQVGTAKSIKEMKEAGKTISGSVHTHGTGEITISEDDKSFSAEGDHMPSKSGKMNDMSSQKTGQTSGLYKGPSIVAGTELTGAQNNSGGVDINKTKVLTYYDGSGNTTTVNYKKFKKAVKEINE